MPVDNPTEATRSHSQLAARAASKAAQGAKWVSSGKPFRDHLSRGSECRPRGIRFGLRAHLVTVDRCLTARDALLDRGSFGSLGDSLSLTAVVDDVFCTSQMLVDLLSHLSDSQMVYHRSFIIYVFVQAFWSFRIEELLKIILA